MTSSRFVTRSGSLAARNQDARLLAAYVVLANVLGLVEETDALSAPLRPTLGHFHRAAESLFRWIVVRLADADSLVFKL